MIKVQKYKCIGCNKLFNEKKEFDAHCNEVEHTEENKGQFEIVEVEDESSKNTCLLC